MSLSRDMERIPARDGQELLQAKKQDEPWEEPQIPPSGHEYG